METKHTPGPWFAKRVRDSETNGDFDIDSVDGYHIAESIGGLDDGEEEANACLIAAAPELLDEARAFTAVVVTHECPSCGIAWSENECSQMLDEKSASCLCGYRHNFDGAVLAKAEGR